MGGRTTGERPNGERSVGSWGVGPLLLRLFLSFVLVYGTQDNVFDRGRMLEFADFLETNGFPWPLLSAHVSAYAQFVCGLLLLLGLFTRPAAFLMVVNFLVALVMVHLGLSFDANIAPMAMLFGSLYFLVDGPGPISLDGWRARRREEAR
ncbi:MAG: DoxX family protein [Gemmatimonadota bacterium]|jgi:putative oxidoreductase